MKPLCDDQSLSVNQWSNDTLEPVLRVDETRSQRSKYLSTSIVPLSLIKYSDNTPNFQGFI